MRCRFPGAPAHSAVDFTNSSLVPGTVASYSCERGFELLGPSRRVCSPSGLWTPEGIPFCAKPLRLTFKQYVRDLAASLVFARCPRVTKAGHQCKEIRPPLSWRAPPNLHIFTPTLCALLALSSTVPLSEVKVVPPLA
ncbi:unnamed protein product [Nezara viridula]|uniref:Sushi domain-containing protein n=1 Tax=Nezara viridula TaxID=85310 RepID=A0A9P0H5Z5_NEZVI|nr:unnamed protein product [Nezara viridula]